MSKVARSAPNLLDVRLQGTRRSAFISEFLSNSGHFLIVNSLSELVLMRWQTYFTEPAHYFIFLAMVVQAWYLSSPKAHRVWGNLLGATLYTLIDLPLEGWTFFAELNHLVLWLFAIIIAVLQGLRTQAATWIQVWSIPLESVARFGMLLALYRVLAWKTYLQPSSGWASPSQYFLSASLLLVGLLVGLQTLQVTQQRQALQQTAQQLRNLAEWGMGSYAVTAAVLNPQALQFRRCDRAIVFMDIRGFTQWCEQTAPDTVARLLNAYYRQVEPAAASFQPLRVTLTADEVMAIYARPEQAVAAAQAMQTAAREVLHPHQLGAGCGIHYGSTIEGLFGSEDVRTYTVIGDVVNAAKRLESATPAGKITISEAVYDTLPTGLQDQAIRRAPIVAKGKSEPLWAWYLGLAEEL
jgi:adenylate cyclase